MSDVATAVSDDSFDQQVIKSSTPVLVDFWAAWCMPCMMLNPIMEALAEEYKGKLKFVKVNVDENPKLSQQYQVMSIPLVGLFKNGQMVKQFVGVQPKDVYVQAINEALA